MMKHKKRFRNFAVLLAALVCLGGFSMTAYAQTPEETPPDTAVVTPTPEAPAQPLPRRATRPLLMISAATSSLSPLPPKAATISISWLTAPPRVKIPSIS